MGLKTIILSMSPAWWAFEKLSGASQRKAMAYYARAGRDMLRLVSAFEANLVRSVEYVGQTPANIEAQNATAAFRANTIALSRMLNKADAATFNNTEKAPAGEAFSDQDWRSSAQLDHEDFFGAMIEADNARATAERLVNTALIDTQNRRIAAGQVNTITTTNANGQTITKTVPVKPINPGSLPSTGPIVTAEPTAATAATALASNVAARVGQVAGAVVNGWANALKWIPTILIVGGVGLGAWWAYRKLWSR
jgi:hypothetical protein